MPSYLYWFYLDNAFYNDPVIEKVVRTTIDNNFSYTVYHYINIVMDIKNFNSIFIKYLPIIAAWNSNHGAGKGATVIS